MLKDYKNLNLFSFVLKCYEILDKEEYKNIFPDNSKWSFTPLVKNHQVLSYPLFAKYIETAGYEPELKNKRFLSFVLQFIDNAIFSFEEYQQLFSKGDEQLSNDKYTLVILPENDISKQINKRYMRKATETFSPKGLRDKRHFNPNKTCYKLNLHHLNFLRMNNLFLIKQKFCILQDLAEDLKKDIIKVGFFPFIKMDKDFSPYIKIKKGDVDFELSYNTNYDDNTTFENKYYDYLEKSLLKKAKIVLLPENSIPFNRPQFIQNTLSRLNHDFDKLIVAGTNWCNGVNKCYVFDDNGKPLVEQNKYNPYCIKGDPNIYENLKQSDPIIINLLHIQSFGLIGFPICSDLLSSKYIESVYCDCDVTSLFIPCMSISRDIMSSLSFLSSNYLISSFVCNTCIGRNNVIGYYCLPTKKKRTTKRSFKERFIHNFLTKKKICSGRIIRINIKNIAK